MRSVAYHGHDFNDLRAKVYPFSALFDEILVQSARIPLLNLHHWLSSHFELGDWIQAETEHYNYTILLCRISGVGAE